MSALLVVICAVVASAHDTWLLPETLRTPVGKTLTISLTSGGEFPADDFAIDQARVRRAIVRLRGATTPLGAGRTDAKSLRYVWRPLQPGLATLGVELAPRMLTLAPDKVAEYLDEIDARAELRAQWAHMPSPKRWRESYTKHAKSYVRVGDPVGDSSWKTPLGLGLELVAQRDPTDLHTGDTFVVRVLRSGVAAPGFHVGALPAGATHATFFDTDAKGDARVVLLAAGRWLLNGTNLRPSAKPQLEWESDFTTLTIAVLASR